MGAHAEDSRRGDLGQDGRRADLRAGPRRRPGKAIVFIIDEVGQHVARSGDKIEDLRATEEEFAKVGKKLCKAKPRPFRSLLP